MIGPALLSVFPLMAFAMALRAIVGWTTIGDRRFAAALAGGGLGAAGFSILLVRTVLAPATGIQHYAAYSAAVSIFLAPPVEEALKGFAIFMVAVAWPWGDRRTGTIIGAIAGLGFAMTENLHYFMRAGDYFATHAGDSSVDAGPFSFIAVSSISWSLWVYVLERLLLVSVMHALAGSWIGAALAGRNPREALGLAIGAWGVAVVVHAAWNIAGWLSISFPFAKLAGGLVLYGLVAGTAALHVLAPRVEAPAAR